MNSDIAEVLFSREEINQKVQELAQKIDHEYGDKEIVTIGILRGAIFFMADILRAFKVKLVMDVMSVSSYGEKDITSSGQVKILNDIMINIKDRDVLIIEDIIDTGLTLYPVSYTHLTLPTN